MASSATTAVLNIPLSNTQQIINLKLTNNNYLFWRMQMKPYLIGQGVFSFVDGSTPCPSSHDFSSTASAVSATFNSEPCQAFLAWKQQDQLILSALLSSLSVEVLHLVVDCSTSASVWSTLELALASPSNSRIMQLHGSLQDLRQGDDIVTLYLQCAKGLFDELVAAGRPISLTDFNLYVFRGLRGEFRDLVTSLSTKVDPLSYSELHSHLSTHEFIHRSSVSSSLTTAPLRSPPQYILPSVVFLGQTAVVSWLIGVEDDGVAGGILTATFLSLTVSPFVVLVVVLLGSSPAATVDSGKTIHTVVQQQISGHGSK
jgi:hypothetical protein